MIKQKFSKIFRKYFITGMIVIIPLWVTIIVIKALVNMLDGTFDLFPPVIHPRTYIPFFGIELLIAVLIIIIVGIITSNFIGKKFVSLGETILAKIPVVKTIYQGVKQLTTGILSEKKMFSRVVLLEFPIKGLFFVGFVTGEGSHIIPGNGGRKMLKIFIPTTPNPTSGFFCIAAEEEVRYLDISVDEAFKLIISAGFS
ncbi:MAG: DUF502 domain-containing protein [Candidatus Aminicenantes bacterium]|nr:MAG: DUF502 domain-containing protein [Candidatus Aminicenantes bacterium]